MCVYSENGSINVTVSGGTPPYTYRWGNFSFSWKNSSGTEISTEENLSGVGVGKYTLEISDLNNCIYEIHYFEINMSH